MYALKEALSGMAHNRSMTLVSIATITLALVVLGVFVIVTLYAHTFMNTLMSGEEINVFLLDSMPDADMLALETSIASMDEVATTAILTKDDAAERFREWFNEDPLVGLDDNPLPRSIVVTMAPGFRMSEDIRRVAFRIRQVEGVESVQYGQEWVSKMDIFFIAFLGVETVLMVLIVIACTLIIGNTISMTVLSRLQTIEIMRLVGATDAFIRRPYYIEGVLQGLIAGVLTFGVLYGAYHWLLRLVPDIGVYAFAFRVHAIEFMPQELVFWTIMPAGALLGFLGSVIALRRAL